MRFFIGSPASGDKKKKSASEIFKRKLQGKVEYELTPEEKYKKVMDEKIAKMTEEILLGKKKAFKLPGTKQEEDSGPQTLTNTQKQMLQLLAQRKMEKERSLEKKKAKQAAEAARAAKKAAAFKKWQEDNVAYAKKKAEEAAVTPAQKSYFFGHSEE